MKKNEGPQGDFAWKEEVSLVLVIVNWLVFLVHFAGRRLPGVVLLVILQLGRFVRLFLESKRGGRKLCHLLWGVFVVFTTTKPFSLTEFCLENLLF